MHPAIVTSLIPILSVISLTRGSVISCDAPAVTEGEPATITCHFNQDVSQTKKQFLVKRRLYWAKFDPASMENVMQCSGECVPAEGYQLSHVGINTVILIKRATNELSGEYRCELVPTENEYIQPCYFYVKDKLAGDGSGVALILDIIILSLLVLIAGGIALFLARKHLMQCFHRRGRKGTDETVEESVRLHDIDKNESNKQMMREIVDRAVMTALIKITHAKIEDCMFENIRKISNNLASKSADEIAHAITEADKRNKQN